MLARPSKQTEKRCSAKMFKVERLETRDLLAGDLVSPIASNEAGLSSESRAAETVEPQTANVLVADTELTIGTARLQVVHNSPYAAAASVDVYVNGALVPALDDFDFREATPYITVPAGIELTLDITAADAEDNSAPVFTKTIVLDDGGTYVAVADGDPTLAQNRSGPLSVEQRRTLFDIFVSDIGQESANQAGNAEFLVFHGSPDAPTVDVIARDVATLVDDISYPEFGDAYISVPPASYVVDITPGDNNETVVASFTADLSAAADAALLVAASGFLAPSGDDPAFGLLAVFPNGDTALLPAAVEEPAEARIQVVHNSPYAAAASVDVYVNGALLPALDDFDFREATPYITVPAGVELTLDITAADAEDNSAPVFTKTVVLDDGATYIAVADGDPTQTETDTAFDIFVSDIGQESANQAGNAEFLVFHGSPDAPTVDVIARDVATLVDDISYPEFGDAYISVPPASYVVDITPGDNNETVVASFTADLSAAADAALLVAASGFLAPSGDDPAFGLLAVFPNGDTALLPAAVEEPAEARIQVVHNSPYAAAASVDVYVNGALLPALDDFDFREATPYITVPAGVELTLDITAADAEDNSAPVFTKTVVLDDGATYIAVADGDPTQTETDTAFDIFVSDIGQESANQAGNAEFLVFHGSPDAPTVDVIARDVATLVDDISYPEFGDAYISVPPASYVVDITPGDDNETVVASFTADLSAAADAALLVAASGFLAPSGDDPAFGLLAVFPNGDTALLPPAVEEPAEARIQVVHNSPYAAAASVDVYVNGALLPALDDFDFREATPYITVPAGVELTLDITAADAEDNSAPVFTKTVVLDGGATYIAVADGDPTLAQNRSGPLSVEQRRTLFDIFVSDIGQESANQAGNAEFLVFHGSPDAPTVDVIARDVATLVDDISYPEFGDAYISVPPASYVVDITPGDDNETVVASFTADLSAAADAALLVAASGFLAPSGDDPAFGLLAVFPNGDTALLPAAIDAAIAEV